MANSTTAGTSSARGRQHHKQHKHSQHHPYDRPAKRRRVEASATARPPVQLAVAQPHGPLNRTVNGVRTQIPVAPLAVDASGALHPDSQHDVATADATTSPTADQKRVLRSQGGGPRLSSDLAHFFPDYEESIFGDPKPQERLNVDSSLYVTDDKSQSNDLPIRDAPSSKTKSNSPSQSADNASPNVSQLTSAKTVYSGIFDLSAFEEEALEFHADPLPDTEYLKAHKRGERNEKQMRNVEKERAQHEKWELERLYEELRGPDWLKTMGISGITETEKKVYEPKRDHYIGRVKALLAKFEKWRENEKELKIKREQALAAKAEDEDEGQQLEEEEEGEYEEQDDEEDENTGAGTEASASSIDAAALQLQQEAESARRSQTKSKAKVYDPTLEQYDSARPFISFYTKPHERAAAVGKNRRGGRHVSAFGQPLPEMSHADFELPEGFLTGEELRDNARKRRREKRESRAKDEK